ncbi:MULTISPECIES: hypothetical protein [Pseudomonas]|jgi:hypothetical protein|uniref:Uncharacterized protein n=2 Tax=Pseudomonas putida TaxID=303 RepID=A0A1X0ZLA2_PSEPU|nr:MULTISPECIES: hypothetical protein [Pseudomonas]EKT4459770.1 hypothetical protein [Pseudomonas putida]EKT4554937.1 hypothetical protein [Pseudomonas putida]EKT4558860.1 hypothetical protein [Pseudomonas putida]ELF6203456.1 hypothetical protein [Pseudomonas putida]ELF6209612.1 hypothetical protein [Pseudomonas putida]
MLMRVREQTYWQWADAQLHSRSHDEVLSDGTTLDVQVRLSRLGATQLFLGLYAGDGRALLEEYYPARPGETMTRALVWGVDRARAMATGALPLPQSRRQRRQA